MFTVRELSAPQSSENTTSTRLLPGIQNAQVCSLSVLTSSSTHPACHRSINYCTDFKELENRFNLQFDTDRSIDSNEMTLLKCEDEEYFILTETAEDYSKWYTEHPLDPVRPIILLACMAMPIEHRAYLAYHHYRGMGFEALEESFNMMFPDDTRDSKQIVAQLNHFRNHNQLLTSLSVFSIRYSWHPKYRPAAVVSAVGAPSASNAPSAPKATARVRLNQDEEKHDDYNDDEEAMARQLKLFM